MAGLAWRASPHWHSGRCPLADRNNDSCRRHLRCGVLNWHKGARMTGLRSLVVCLGFCLAGLTTCSSVALAEGTSSGSGTGASSSLGGPLVIPGALEGEQQAQAAEQAKLASPEAVAE